MGFAGLLAIERTGSPLDQMSPPVSIRDQRTELPRRQDMGNAAVLNGGERLPASLGYQWARLVPGGGPT